MQTVLSTVLLCQNLFLPISLKDNRGHDAEEMRNILLKLILHHDKCILSLKAKYGNDEAAL